MMKGEDATIDFKNFSKSYISHVKGQQSLDCYEGYYFLIKLLVYAIFSVFFIGLRVSPKSQGLKNYGGISRSTISESLLFLLIIFFFL